MGPDIGFYFIMFIISLFIIIPIGLMIYSQYFLPLKNQSKINKNKKLTSLPFTPMVLEIFLIQVIPLYINDGVEAGFLALSSAVFKTIFIIMLYFPIFYFLLRYLREHYQARTVAILWTVPNLIFDTIIIGGMFNSPLKVFIPSKIIYNILVIWVIGFILILGYYNITHFTFMKRMKKEIQKIDDPEIIEVFDQVATQLNCKSKLLKVYYNPNLNTPLSYQSAFENRVILPSLEYSEDELQLIFKHELIHLCRGDSSFKFYIALCKAICWFNPFVWKCLRKSADDIELSCDETVVEELDDTARKQYASLILNTVGDERGFTTCLSANGQALKYRLSHIFDHSHKKNGYALLITIILSVLILPNFVTMGISGNSLNNTIWKECNQISYIDYNDECYENIHNFDTINDYLNTLDLCTINNVESYADYESERVVIDGSNEKYDYYLTIYNHAIEIWKNKKEDYGDFEDKYYYVKDEIDFEYIESLLKENNK